LAGIASWGYVVVAADYFEHSLAAEILAATSKQGLAIPSGAAAKRAAALDLSVMLTSLDAVQRASADRSSVLRGTVDPKEVAAIGHSLGGLTAFDALNSSRVRTAIGWSPVGPLGPPSNKPVMIIHPTGDDVVTTSLVDSEYRAFPGPKSLVQPSGSGHDAYTDTCAVIRQGGGLIQYAVANHFITATLAKLAFSGCLAKDVAPQRFWKVVQYYTVFELRARLGAGPTAVPVPAKGTFPGFKVSVAQKG
jgi:dienelactone hydrolase